MANGGKNIRRRIEAIARFKRYPAGMALVGVCAALVLAGPCLMGTRAQGVYTGGLLPQRLRPYAAMASARTTCCTTYAGAFDTYAKAVLAENPVYLAMCAPLLEQDALAAELRRAWEHSAAPNWDTLPETEAYAMRGYQIYNLAPAGNGYEGLLAVEVPWSPELGEWDGTVHSRYLATQPLRAEKQGDRWVILPLGDFQVVQGDERVTGNLGLPAWVYEAQCGDFTLRMRYQTAGCVTSSHSLSVNGSPPLFAFDTFPPPRRRVYQQLLQHRPHGHLHRGPGKTAGDQERRRLLRPHGGGRGAAGAAKGRGKFQRLQLHRQHLGL